MVVPCERTSDLFDFCDCDLIWDAVNLGFVDGAAEHLVAIFDADILHIDGVLGSVSEFVLLDADGVVLSVAQIDGIYRGALN